MNRAYSTNQVAKRNNCKPWQVRRLFERGLLPETNRFGRNRIIFESDLPTVEAALVEAGYVKRSEPAMSA